MRNFKFRGKTNSGRWIYGCLVYSDNIQPAIYFEVGAVAKSFDWVYVIPESIGEFTGIKDKNGKEIFEDDIVRIHGKKRLVYFSLCEFSNGWRLKYKKSSIKIGLFQSNEIELIGNKFDDSELI